MAGHGSETASLDGLIERMARDEFDLIAVGRVLLQDPLWAQKVKQGRFDELKAYEAEALKTLY